MFSLFYNVALLLLAILALPKLLWQWAILGKYKKSLSERLGIKLPRLDFPKRGPVIWIHAVSMGETRAAIPFFQKLKQKYPDAAILISSTTETGHAEAKRSMPEADAHFFLPFDFSWVIRRLVTRLRPTALILVESDFWYHLVKETKREGARLLLINGKVSERSAKRFHIFPYFADRIFSLFDHLCVQSDRFRERFTSLGVDPAKITVTGNLKFDLVPQKMGEIELLNFKQTLGIEPHDKVVVIGSTHDPEEEWILSALESVWAIVPNSKVLLVPRHPERFAEVAHLIKRRQQSVAIYSQRNALKGDERVILIDAMGLLPQCYQVAEVAIVGGSFTDRIGGHNIFEPIHFDVPVLFGPHMHGQLDTAELVLQGKAGLKTPITEMAPILIRWLTQEEERQEYAQACKGLVALGAGSVQRTFDAIHEFL